MSKRRKSGNERKTIYLLLGLISVLLIALLYYFTGNQSGFISGREITEKKHGEYSKPADNGKPDYDDNIKPSDSGGTAGTGGETAVPAGSKGKIYFIIDDVGNNLNHLQRFLDFPGKITFAVMPQRTYSEASVKEINSTGKEYIIHQPMEAVSESSNPGQGAVFSGMDRQTIFDIMSDNLDSVPGAQGMNNHMGSRVTSDPVTISFVFEFLKMRKMFFLDSMTMPVEKSDISMKKAYGMSLDYAQRNSMFLDNDDERSSILEMISKGKKVAGKQGHAVMIGHAVTSELAEILIEIYPELIDEGYSLHGISELFEDE